MQYSSSKSQSWFDFMNEGMENSIKNEFIESIHHDYLSAHHPLMNSPTIQNTNRK